ncbi:MAG: glucokinase, partial [Burkholderiales bacterium]|nr:glucokinase [Burkholderiales bacterium]
MSPAPLAFADITPAHGPWLVADIGGTNARLGWVEGPGGDVRHVRTLPVQGHAHPQDAVHAYLDLVGPLIDGPTTPRRAALAVATAVGHDEIVFTNSHWRFSVDALQRALGLDRLQVLNDFEALALSLPRLGAGQLRPIGSGLPRPEGTLAVIGPGTGLGVGGVTRTRHGWVALPGEGGHATLAPADEFESAVLAAARTRFEHVSAERLLSGIGLPVLHASVAEALGHSAELLPAELIVERGVAGADAL